MPRIETWTAVEDEDGERLDRHLARRLDEPRNQVRRWIENDLVRLNGRPAKPSSPVQPGDEIAVEPPPRPTEERVAPEAGALVKLYEDDEIVVVDKPAGLAVHPGAGRAAGTLVHRFLHHYPEMAGVGGPGRPGIVHRLDLDTTGVLVAARTVRAYRRLSAAFAERAVEKHYAAVAYGIPRADSGRVDLPIGRDPRDRKRMAVLAAGRGRPALTEYRCRQSAEGISWFELTIETGRTHQIRIHLKAIGHPLVGDPVYGEARWRGLPPRRQAPLRAFPRPALHARRLAFAHPSTGERVEVEAPLPADLVELWRRVTGEDPP